MKYEIIPGPRSDAETVVLSAGLGGSAVYWHPQMSALARHFQVVLYDQRGTGRNAASLPKNYALEDMANEVVEILDSAQLSRVHFVGHALGGLIGLALTRQAPQRVQRLVLVNSWDTLDRHTARCFDARLNILEAAGIEGYVQAQPIFLYPAAWLSANAERIETEVAHGIRNFQSVDNLRIRIAALRNFNAQSDLHSIEAETLVMATRDDVLVPWTCSLRLAQGLPNATLHITPSGGHASTVSESAAFNATLLGFLQATTEQLSVL